jgi:hypothetical protein
MEHGAKLNGVRLLLILAVVIGITSLVLDFRFDNTLTATRTSAYAAEREMNSLQLAVAELRGAQVAYLAAGQSPHVWMGHAADLAERIQTGFARLETRPLSAGARMRLRAAAGAFAVLMSADGRARDHLVEEQHLLASDAIFVEGFDAGQRIASEISSARAAEADVYEAATAQTARLRLGAHGTAIGLVLVLTLFAARLSQQPPASEASTMAQMLRTLPPPVKTAPLTPAAAKPAAVASASATSSSSSPSVPVPALGTTDDAAVTEPAPAAAGEPVPAPPPAPPPINLRDAAELCGDLARVLDERDVPVLLERAANVLDASGVILWVADPDTGRLQPMLTHGYGDRLLRRLGTLDVDADNVTSLAFRSMRPQQVSGHNGSSAGALAVPLVTAHGCTGVLAAEVRDVRLGPDALALARIIAAQFATIIAPADPSASRVAKG